MIDLVKELLSRSSDQDGIGWTPTTVVHVPAGLLHRAADRIAQLEAALLTGVCMLSEMGLDPREKCQMAYDYMSAALGEDRT